MKHPTSKIAVAMWAAGTDPEGPPAAIINLEAANPGAGILLGKLHSLNPRSTANEIQQAFAQGLGQCDFVSVLPEPEPEPSTRPTIPEIARLCHEANRTYCESIGDISQVPWEQAPAWQQESAIEGVEFAIANNYPSPESMHENWMKDKAADGWVYGETKDPEAKTHPAMLPYDQLPAEQKAKDGIFRKTVMDAMGVSE